MSKMNDEYKSLIAKTAAKRVRNDKILNVVSIIFAVLGLLFLFWIMFTLVIKGLAGFSLSIFIDDTIIGGLRNALVGHTILVAVASIVGIPLGLLAGTYLSEYGGPNDKKSNFVRNMSDVMMSTPSIVIGAFIYAVMVKTIGGYSGLAGAIALAVMMIPVVLKTTDDMLTLVPQTLREAAFALGAPKYKVIFSIVFRAAKNGLLTGVILAIARVAGETAPLLFTSFHNDFLTLDLFSSMPSLTNTIYEFTQAPDYDKNAIAWTGALLLAVVILGVNIVARYIIRTRKVKN